MGDAPTARDGHCAAYDAAAHRLVVFGGRGTDRRRLNDVHHLDPGHLGLEARYHRRHRHAALEWRDWGWPTKELLGELPAGLTSSREAQHCAWRLWRGQSPQC